MKIAVSAVSAALLLVTLAGCGDMLQRISSLTAQKPLTESDISSGLKQALIVGAKHAAQELGSAGGYYSNPDMRIALPPEAAAVTNNIKKIPGIQSLVDDVILRINRSAEHAAARSAPVFKHSIRQMTIRDAANILYGADNAATQYLHKTCYKQLFELYRPHIESALNRKLAGTLTAADAWARLTDEWNRLAESPAGSMAGFSPIETDLEAYLTREALDALFYRIQQEEIRIRKNPAQRTTYLLKRVFGKLDKDR
jgi:hypothetical protein